MVAIGYRGVPGVYRRGQSMRLAGCVAVVTGGASGIGRVLAERLLADGAAVAILDIVGGAERAQSLRERRSGDHLAANARVIGLSCDVSNEDQVAAAISKAAVELGRIDILVNNAALFSALSPGPFEDISADSWQRVMAVNTLGPFLCARAVLPHLKASGRGRIINLASGAPLKGVPNMLHYVTSKGAVIALTRALARELGTHGITVNAVAPGFTMSDGVLAHPVHAEKYRDVILASRAIKRDETPQDIAGAVSFLASDDAAFLTGQTLVVDGGSAMV